MTLSIHSAALAKLVEDLDLFVRSDVGLRLIQSGQAPQNVKAWYGNTYSGLAQGVLPNAGNNFVGGALSATTPFQPLADPNYQGSPYSYLLFITDENSGKFRYTIDGTFPKADGSVGLPGYSGGAVVPVYGAGNIQNFRAIAEAAATVNYAAVLFR